MRIVHFSDIHVGTWTRDPAAFLDKRILGQLNYHLRRRPHFHPEYLARAVHRIRHLSPDLVLCTGDLTCVGSPEEFALAAQALEPLWSPPGPSCFACLPGNHDAYVASASCRAALETTFARLNGGLLRQPDVPRELRFPGLRVLLADAAGPTHPLLSSGRLRPAAAAAVRAWMEAPRQADERRVLVSHFPLRNAHGQRLGWRRGLADADALWDRGFSRGGVDLCLCGHEHRPFLRRETGGALEICAGSLTVWGRFSVVDYTPQDGRFSHHWEDVSGAAPEQGRVDGEEAAGAGH